MFVVSKTHVMNLRGLLIPPRILFTNIYFWTKVFYSIRKFAQVRFKPMTLHTAHALLIAELFGRAMRLA